MTDNRTTETLCKLLEERGEDYARNDFGVTWGYYNDPHTATESMDGTLIVTGLTPEQAIAATLGSEHTAHGTLTAEQVREAAKSNSRKYKSPVDDGIWMKEYDWQAIADELNATLGGGECIPHGEWESISQTQEVRRMFCDCGYELGMDERDSFPFERTQLFAMPNYCQECGRKIQKAVGR